MFESISATIASYSITSIIIIILSLFLLGRFAKKVFTNIIMGGLLYFILDATNIVQMSWSTFDGIIVALFGVFGTIMIAISHFF